jgi:hypothetical protein
MAEDAALPTEVPRAVLDTSVLVPEAPSTMVRQVALFG